MTTSPLVMGISGKRGEQREVGKLTRQSGWHLTFPGAANTKAAHGSHLSQPRASRVPAAAPTSQLPRES